jgi:hypothetical protein
MRTEIIAGMRTCAPLVNSKYLMENWGFNPSLWGNEKPIYFWEPKKSVFSSPQTHFVFKRVFFVSQVKRTSFFRVKYEVEKKINGHRVN